MPIDQNKARSLGTRIDESSASAPGGHGGRQAVAGVDKAARPGDVESLVSSFLAELDALSKGCSVVEESPSSNVASTQAAEEMVPEAPVPLRVVEVAEAPSKRESETAPDGLELDLDLELAAALDDLEKEQTKVVPLISRQIPQTDNLTQSTTKTSTLPVPQPDENPPVPELPVPSEVLPVKAEPAAPAKAGRPRGVRGAEQAPVDSVLRIIFRERQKRRNKRIGVVAGTIAIVMAVIGLAVCGRFIKPKATQAGERTAQPAAARTLVDEEGKTVSAAKPSVRIIGLDTPFTSIGVDSHRMREWIQAASLGGRVHMKPENAHSPQGGTATE